MAEENAKKSGEKSIGAAHVLIVLGAFASLLPFVSAGVALLAGAILGLTLGNPYAATTKKISTRLLQASVVGLGAGMDLRVVVRVGAHGVFYTFAGIAFCLGLGALLAKLFKVESNIGTLISVGTAICGGSAIAAVAPVIRSKEHEVTVALATVFLLNGVALFLFPWIGHLVALDQTRFGLWAALAIHDTSSVVGAGLAYGPEALDIATTVKLARALWIVPVTMAVGFWVTRKKDDAPKDDKTPKKQAPAKPWFIAGFLIAAALVTFVPQLHDVGKWIASGARHAMAATLFLIGAGLTRKALASVGARALLLGLALWVIVGSASLGALLVGLIK